MKTNVEKHYRRSIRLKDYNYASAGSYFITICTKNKECLFGNVINSTVELTSIGRIAHKSWLNINKHFENIELDEFIIMPNHIHGIITINDVGAQYIEPLQNKFQYIIPKSIGSIIRTYKSAVSRWCNRNGYKNFKWQRNYFEHIIRNEKEINEIREYIINNPLKWDLDKENPNNIM